MCGEHRVQVCMNSSLLLMAMTTGCELGDG